MSKGSVKKFFTELENNPELKEKYFNAMAEYKAKTDELLSETLIDLAKNNGFDFTKSDLHETKSEIIDQINTNTELSDKDLASVSGGDATTRKLSAAFCSIFSVGIGCAILSAVRESQIKGLCGADMTTIKDCSKY